MIQKCDLLNIKPHNKEKWEVRICPICKKEFEIYKSSNQKYCSKSCGNKGYIRHKKIMLKICPICNKNFEIKHRKIKQIYCSKKCAGESLKKKHIKICPTCGKTFEIKYGQLKQIYCSMECRSMNSEYIKNKKIGSKKYYEAKIKKYNIEICPTCNKYFKQYRKNQIYCSQSCRSKNTYVVKSCPICNKKFKSLKSKNQKHCSKECLNKSRELNIIHKICPTCGKSFDVIKALQRQIYCSIKCRSENQKYKIKLSKAQIGMCRNKNRIEQTCPVCRKIFINGQKHNRMYCSDKCKNEDKTETKTCPICGEKYKSYKYRNTKYCSKKCMIKDPKLINKNLIRLRNNTCKKPTRPQTVLLLIIKYLYPNENIIFENPVDSLRYSIDVAIPRRMLGFEYDEPKFHKNNPWENKVEYDKKRHIEIEFKGWNLTHYENENELKQLIPLDMWCKINGKIKKTTSNERFELVELCSHNAPFENILNMQFNPKYKHIHTPQNLIEQTCPTCGKPFKMERWKHQIYCSPKCRSRSPEYINNRKNGQKKYYEKQPRINTYEVKNCPVCGKSFGAYTTHPRVCCSRECANILKKKHKKQPKNIEKYLACTDTISI